MLDLVYQTKQNNQLIVDDDYYVIYISSPAVQFIKFASDAIIVITDSDQYDGHDFSIQKYNITTWNNLNDIFNGQTDDILFQIDNQQNRQESNKKAFYNEIDRLKTFIEKSL